MAPHIGEPERKTDLAFALACHDWDLGRSNRWRRQCQFESSTIQI